MARLSLLLAIPSMLAVAWRLMPSSRWPVVLTSCAFPIFLLQGWVGGFILWGINRFPKAFEFFHTTVTGNLAIALSVCALAGIASLLIRKISPKTASVIFGGR